MKQRFAAADGMTLIEVLMAILILTIAVGATFTVFVSSGHSTHVSEGQEAEVHQAQRELERLQSLPYAQLGLTSAPSVSSNQSSPNFYVTASPSTSCPSFRWNQSSGATNATDQLIVNTCVYNGNTFTTGTVQPSSTRSDSQQTYTIYDYITWVNDSLCAPGVGCPVNNDYKRVTVEVVNNTSSATLAPSAPVLVSAIVTDPHQLPVVGNPNANNPLDSTSVTCTNGSGQRVICNNGLGNQTGNVFYLTNSLEQNGYTAPTGDNSCMHYTDQQIPLVGGVLNCGGTTGLGTCTVLVLTGCPQPDLLNAPPPSTSISQEYNFSPNLAASTSGRVLKRDPNATSCSATPSSAASEGEFWATRPLSAQLNLSGTGAMTLYTNTLHGLAANVTLCVGVYLESPVLGILDPLNLLGSDSVQLGVVGYTMAQWPAVPTPLSFTFTYMGAARLAAAGTSIGVRLWVAASSLDDIVVHYDAPTVGSSVEINSQ